MTPDSSKITSQAIATITTPFKDAESIPIQGTANTARGTIAFASQYAKGLADLEGFDRIWLIYQALKAEDWKPLVVPRLDEAARGIFATRSLLRPNPIGLSCVKLLKVEHQTVHIEGVDMLDGSPLLDMKPYVARYDSYPDAWSGWLEHSIPHQDAWRDKN